MVRPCRLQGQRDGGRQVGKHRSGEWCQEARSRPGGVPCDGSSLSPVTPSPTAAAALPACPSLQPPSAHGCCGCPQHSGGARGAHTTNPPRHLPPLLPSRSQHKLSCFLRVSFLVLHYANPPTTPKSLYFLFSPVRGRAQESHRHEQRQRHQSARDFLSRGRRAMQRGQESIFCCVHWGTGRGVMGFKSQGARLMLDICC